MAVKWHFVLMVAAAIAVVTPVVLVIHDKMPPTPEPVEDGAPSSPSYGQFIQTLGPSFLRLSGLSQTEVTIHSFKGWVSPDQSTAPGHSLFALEISLRNDSESFYHLNPSSQCTVLASDGQTYRSAQGGPTPRLPNRKMDPGDSVRGFICFALPDGADGSHFLWGFQKIPIPNAKDAA